MTRSTFVQTRLGIGLAALALGLAPAAAAEDFDGSKPLVCAPVRAIDCVPGSPCIAATPDEMGAPRFLRIDFAGKKIIGPHRVARIASSTSSETQLLLQGVELGHAFALALDRTDGTMTATLNDAVGAFVLFGSCTPL